MLQRTPIYQQLADDLGDLIHLGFLRPGERLSSVRKLAHERGVSISTVVQALRVLEEQAMIEARPQSGFFVKLPEFQQALGIAPKAMTAARGPVAVDINRRLMDVHVAVA